MPMRYKYSFNKFCFSPTKVMKISVEGRMLIWYWINRSGTCSKFEPELNHSASASTIFLVSCHQHLTMVSINVNAIAIHDSLELSLFDQRWRYRRSPLTSNKWSNSFSRISRVTYGNHEKDCHVSASGWLIPYKLLLHNIIFI